MGKPYKLVASLKDAVRSLKSSNVDTLIFWFSGKYKSPDGFLVGVNEEYMSASDLEEQIRQLEVEKLILLLDCVNAPYLNCARSCLRVDSGINNELVELCEIEKTLIAKFFRQALLRDALDDVCINAKTDEKVCNACDTLSETFITFYDIQQYVAEHFDTFMEEKARTGDIFAPRKARASTHLDDFKHAIVAFRYNFPVTIEIVVKSDETFLENISPFSFLNIQDLKKIIFDKLKGR